MKLFCKFSFYFFLFSFSIIYPFSLRQLYSSDQLNSVCMNIDKDYKSKTNYDSFLSFINYLFQKKKKKFLKKRKQRNISKFNSKRKIKRFYKVF